MSRDRTAKLHVVSEERFIDNITSITPGALKGGIASVARHPERNEIVIGGADGVPKVYRMFRITQRRIGDDANVIRILPSLSGRIYSVDVSRDGRRIAAASSLDGRGQVGIYSYEFNSELPKNLEKIMSKKVDQRNDAEKKALEDYRKKDVRRIALVDVGESAVFSVAFRPDGAAVAVAGADGIIRMIETETGEILSEFEAAPVEGKAKYEIGKSVATTEDPTKKEFLPKGTSIRSLRVQPATIRLSGEFDYTQILVHGTLKTGERIDATRMATMEMSTPVAAVPRSGLIRPLKNGVALLKVRLDNRTVSVPVTVSNLDAPSRVDFIRDVNPVLSRVGCNAGTCHGSKDGRAGFKLSLRGYDAVADVRALTDDLASRRVNIVSPRDSLMLLKPTAGVPHEGGQVIRPGSSYYRILERWIAGGSKLDLAAPRVSGIEVFPENPVLRLAGERQQIRVVATYEDGEIRDVTRESIVTSGNTEISTVDGLGIVTGVRRGESSVLARFEGKYAATSLTVMGDRSGFAWVLPITNNRIDELVAEKWKRMKILPSKLCTDAEFIRRVHIDLTGLPPSSDELRAFLKNADRNALVDRLIGSDAFIEQWTNKWADLLQVNRKFLGVKGAATFRKWIRKEVAANTPYDKLVRKILTATGSNLKNPAASYYKILREPAEIVENTTQLFLGTRFSCNKCHDHPFERWTQDQYYDLAAYFARVGRKRDPVSKKDITGTAVEKATPMII